MKTLNSLAIFINRVVWMIGVIAIMDYSQKHWPFPYRVVTVIFLIGLGAWYFWKFLFQPFRSGLKGEGYDKHDA